VSVPGPVLAPCTSWIDGADVQGCCTVTAESSDEQALLEEQAVTASMILFELSGRQFTGLCERTVRPCRDGCGCFGQSLSLGLGPWYWGGLPGGSWFWRNECGDRCGCRPLSTVLLSGYPVREITEVKIDGAVLDPSGYRLDGWRTLVRLDDAGPPVVRRRWPGCQNLALEDTEPGTFSVRYRHGVEPPEGGRRAAAALACQLYLACSGGDCNLPTSVSRVVRQGVTMERIVPVAELLRMGGTGLPALDAFVAAYNPNGLRRRPAVWSPDGPRYARRVGT
jgi:hypothetical protein